MRIAAPYGTVVELNLIFSRFFLLHVILGLSSTKINSSVSEVGFEVLHHPKCTEPFDTEHFLQLVVAQCELLVFRIV